jgi:hypothetical protein
MIERIGSLGFGGLLNPKGAAHMKVLLSGEWNFWGII